VVVRTRLLLTLLCALPVRAGDKPLLKHGDIAGGAGWTHGGASKTLTFKVDHKTGKKKRGSLFVANTDPEDAAARSWFHSFEPPEKPGRLKLTVWIRAQGLQVGSDVNAMVQLLSEKGPAVGHAWCGGTTQDTDWKEVHAVFDVPAKCKTIRILAYLVGPGEAWFDDFAVTRTEDPVTKPPQRKRRIKDDEFWKLMRSCAEDIEWRFDSRDARAYAVKRGKPLLVYVRCTDNREGLASAQKTLRAEDVFHIDDGLRKDILFRAGPLSDPDIAAMVNRRFVPLLVTYLFRVHGTGRGSLMAWSTTSGSTDTKKYEVDAKLGAKEPGSLKIEKTDATDSGADNWFQTLQLPAGQHKRLKLKATTRARHFVKGSESCVMLKCSDKDGKALSYARVPEIRKNTNWKKQEVNFAVPPECTQIVVRAYLVGQGTVWFDDLALVAPKVKENLLKNGHVDPREGGDPLAEFGYKSTEAVTPALLVTDPHGKPVRRLHRIGSLSADFIDHWLRHALKEAGASFRARGAKDLFALGELSQVLAVTEGKIPPEDRKLRARAQLRLGDLDDALETIATIRDAEAESVRGYVFLRRGAWKDARAAFAKAGGTPAARFWQGWCLQRLGKQKEAMRAWKAIAGPTRYGRKAAACLSANGPRLWLSETTRLWPRPRALLEATEGFLGFDAAQSVRLLIGLQNADGSFGSHHRGAPGQGFWDGTITALAADALERWRRHLPKDVAQAAGKARDQALRYLAAWGKRRNARNDAFNNPYVLMYLVRAKRRGPAREVVGRIAESQEEDGNWTVYHAGRPASFNTALNVMALAEAKQAGIKVPEKVLKSGTRALAAMRQKGDLFPYSTGPGHEWMTTEHGAIARDPLCEHALLVAGEGSTQAQLDRALARFLKFADELRAPTKHYFDYFNSRGHGGYYFFFAHRNAFDAAALAGDETRERVRAFVRRAVLAVREGDGAFMDHYMNGRAYATAQALAVLAPSAGE
jgi:tetratricopeptide (TPR) repeat protein